MLKPVCQLLMSLLWVIMANFSYSDDFPARLTLISWNILDDSTLSQERGLAVLDVLSETPADIILLQEVTLPLIEKLKKDRRFSDYQIYSRQRNHRIVGGLAIVSKIPIKTTARYEQLPSMMRRGLLYIMLKNKDQFLCIANVHLESMMDDTTMRIKQLTSTFNHLSYCDDIILAGDFNFGKGEPEEVLLKKQYTDVWLQLKPNNRGLTYNRELNERSDDNAFWFEKSRRLDRFYISGDCLAAKQIQLTGNKPDANNQMPSDHFALLATFSYKVSCQ